MCLRLLIWRRLLSWVPAQAPRSLPHQTCQQIFVRPQIKLHSSRLGPPEFKSTSALPSLISHLYSSGPSDRPRPRWSIVQVVPLESITPDQRGSPLMEASLLVKSSHAIRGQINLR